MAYTDAGNTNTYMEKIERPTAVQDPRVDALKNLILSAHPHRPDNRCTARVFAAPQQPARPPGPVNPPIGCCLPAGHDGPHKCNYGGMSHPISFDPKDEVEFGAERPGHCASCRTSWPCPTVVRLNAIVDGP